MVTEDITVVDITVVDITPDAITTRITEQDRTGSPAWEEEISVTVALMEDQT